MARSLSESDWKLFRKLQEVALERFCDRVLVEVTRIAAETSKSSHDRYLAVFKMLKKRDRELEIAFHSPQRSTAYEQLSSILSLRLLTKDEYDQFSSAVRAALKYVDDESDRRGPLFGN